MWNWHTGEEIKCLQEHAKLVTSLVFQHGLLYSGSEDGQVCVWNPLMSDFPIFVHGYVGDPGIRCLAVHRNRIIAGRYDGKLQVLHHSPLLIEKHESDINAICCVGNKIYTVSDDETIVIVNFEQVYTASSEASGDLNSYMNPAKPNYTSETLNILWESQRPMSCPEIFRAIMKRKMLKFKGKTPENSLNAAMHRMATQKDPILFIEDMQSVPHEFSIHPRLLG